MNLQPMHPKPMPRQVVQCCKCDKMIGAGDVLCDMDGKYGDFYCPPCATKAQNPS